MVVNPVSGGIDKRSFIDAVSVYAHKKKLNLILFETSGNTDSVRLKSVFEENNPSRIIIVGGDGTIKLVVETIDNSDVIFGILPAGSSNGLATDLNLIADLERNIEIAFGDKITLVDVVSLNGQKSLHLSDIGLNAELIRNYQESSVRGKLGYVLQILNTWIDSDDFFYAQITANGKTVECAASMIVIANSQKYGTGVVINPNGSLSDGKFEIIILKNLDFIVFTKIVAGYIPDNTEDIEIISAEKATISTKNPVCFQIDGEYCGMVKSLDIKILTEKIKIAVS